MDWAPAAQRVVLLVQEQSPGPAAVTPVKEAEGRRVVSVLLVAAPVPRPEPRLPELDAHRFALRRLGAGSSGVREGRWECRVHLISSVSSGSSSDSSAILSSGSNADPSTPTPVVKPLQVSPRVVDPLHASPSVVAEPRVVESRRGELFRAPSDEVEDTETKMAKAAEEGGSKADAITATDTEC